MRFDETTGGKGESDIFTWLKKAFPHARRMRYGSPWDIAINGLRVEVKCCNFSRGQWVINLHRHGRLSESADYYVFRLLGCPFWKGAVHLIVPCPVKSKTVAISPRSLITKWAICVGALDLLRNATAEKLPWGQRPVTIYGETKFLSAWLERYGLSEATYRARRVAGWNEAEAIIGRPKGMSQAERRRPRLERVAAQMRTRSLVSTAENPQTASVAGVPQ